MRKRFHRPSPAFVISLVALFVALGGTTYAATGGNVILGKANTATAQTGLTANLAGKALSITQQNTGTGATALGLNVPSGKPPMTVNSGTKVANLNADVLDGLDSTALQRRVGGPCSSGSAMQAIAGNGAVTCQNTQTSVDLDVQGTGAVLPYQKMFTTHGGPLLLYFSGSGYTESYAGTVALEVGIDGSPVRDSQAYTNEMQSHKATVPVFAVLSGYAAGTHTFTVSQTGGTSDDNDAWNAMIVELPH